MAQGENDALPKKRWWLKSVIALLLVLALAVAGFFAWRRYEPERLTRQAREYYAKGDFRHAVLNLRRALQIDPSNISASRLMVEITESLQAPDALDWRRRVSELNPGSAPEALAVAGTALKQGNIAAASQALASVPESQQNTAAWHASAGMVAMSRGQFEEAEKHLATAVKLEPQNELHQYNFATLQIQSRDPEQRAAGAAALERLAQSGRVQMFARRALVKRLVADEKWEEALAQSTGLQGDAAVTFPDRLAHLDILRKLNRPEIAEALIAAEKAALARPEDVAALMEWRRLSGLAADAVAWAGTLDEKLTAAPVVSVAMADCLVELKSWETLGTHTIEGNWGEMDYLRRAFLARALHEQNDRDGAQANWAAATAAAVKQKNAAARLVLTASQWGWTEPMRETLWAAALAPGPDWALQILNRLYQSEGDAEGLLRVARRFLEARPDNDAARNNVAALSLLLGRDYERALETARALHEKAPSNGAFASTYALALHLAGRSEEGLAVLKKLPPAAFLQPEIAGYLGLLLKSTGAAAEAVPHLELAKKANFLPEEKTLIFGSGAI